MRVVLGWLNDELQRNDCGNPDIARVPWIELWMPLFCALIPCGFVVCSLAALGASLSQVVFAADSWARGLLGAGMFLTDRENEQRKILGQLFLKLYVRLARQALDSHKRLYRCRPKLHLLVHMSEDDRPSSLNPAHLNCFMDEDFIKRSMAIKKGVHRLTATVRTLQRFIIGLRARLIDAQSKLKQLSK